MCAIMYVCMFVCMRVCVRVCMRGCGYVHACACACMFVCVCVCGCLCVCACARVRMSVCECTYVCSSLFEFWVPPLLCCVLPKHRKHRERCEPGIIAKKKFSKIICIRYDQAKMKFLANLFVQLHTCPMLISCSINHNSTGLLPLVIFRSGQLP